MRIFSVVIHSILIKFSENNCVFKLSSLTLNLHVRLSNYFESISLTLNLISKNVWRQSETFFGRVAHSHIQSENRRFTSTVSIIRGTSYTCQITPMWHVHRQFPTPDSSNAIKFTLVKDRNSTMQALLSLCMVYFFLFT